MQLVRVSITDPQNVLDTYGALAKYRIERDTTSAMSGAAEIATGTVVAGTTEYEYADATGVAGTHWYRVRYSKASPSVAADYSGYSAVFQAGSPAGQLITLDGYKVWANIPQADIDDDGWLVTSINAVNRAALGPTGVGVDLGPSPDTVRTYDLIGPDGYSLVVRNGTRLPIPGGIRDFTTVEVSTDGTTWTDITTSVRVGPLPQARAAGDPGDYIELKPYNLTTTGFLGYVYVRITGPAFATFGWDAYPEDLVQAAYVAVQRMSRERDSQGQYLTETNALRYLDKALLASYRNRYFPPVR